MTKLRLAEIVGVLSALVLPLVGAHYLFYSALEISPSDVGLDFGDLAQRSSPGLIGMLIILSALIIGLYSIVIWMNVILVPFYVRRTTGIARRLSVIALGLAFLSLLIGPLQRVAGWILLLWLLLLTGLGLAVVVPRRRKEMAIGLLIGAPSYVILQAVGLLVMYPLILADPESTLLGGDPPLATLLLVVPAVLFLALAYAVLLLPAMLVVGADPAQTGSGWARIHVIGRYLTIRRAAAFFTAFVLVATHVTIFGLAVWNAEAIKRGWDVGVFGSAALDEAVQHTYGLPASCVALRRVKPYARKLPRTAIRLGSRREADYALVWDRRGAVMVPNDVVQLTPLRQAACITGP